MERGGDGTIERRIRGYGGSRGAASGIRQIQTGCN